MKRFDVRYRPEAVSDLEDIFRYIPERSQSMVIASGYVRRIKARCDRIGDAPHGGRMRDDLEEGLRITGFERRAAIAWKVEGDTVRITNIFYGGRDYEALFRTAGNADD